MDKTNQQDTKKLLLQISTELFNEKNFDDVSINEICHRAGVTKGAFYHYFSSKYDITIQQYREIQELFFLDYQNNVNLPVQERFYKVIMWYSEYCSMDNITIFRNYYKAMLNTDKSRLMRKIEMNTKVLKELIVQGQAVGLFRKNINVAFYTEMISRFVFSLVLDWTIFNGKIDLQKELAYLYRNIVNMLAPEKQ